MTTPFVQAVRSFISAEVATNRRLHPHVVRQRGLLRLVMEDDEFLAQLSERRRWIAAHCRGSIMFDDLTNESGDVIGKLYRFEDADEAFWFRMCF